MPFLAVPAAAGAAAAGTAGAGAAAASTAATIASYAAAASAVAGLGLSAYGAVSSADRASTQAKAQQDQIDAASAAERDRLSIAEAERQRRLSRVLATQRAMAGAGGINSASGSTQNLRAASVGEAAREQYAEDLFAYHNQRGRDARSSYNTYNAGTIAPARNLQIGSSIVGAAGRYAQTLR